MQKSLAVSAVSSGLQGPSGLSQHPELKLTVWALGSRLQGLRGFRFSKIAAFLCLKPYLEPTELNVAPDANGIVQVLGRLGFGGFRLPCPETLKRERLTFFSTP